ncbi:MAG TPA: hypothetical protein VGI50_09530 [Solirubrobacteraceae bacterium]
MSAVTASRARSTAPRRAHARGGAAPAVPRRVSGPAGGRVRSQPRPQQGATAGARALSLVRSLPDHSLVDRLVRGRAWIPVLGVLLVGIVAMQVEILKVGTSLGRSLERSTSLQSQNESLQAGVAGLAEYQRIERLATGMGMVMPSPGLLTFVAPHPRVQLSAGLNDIHAPDPTGFAPQLATDMAAAELAAPSTTNTSSQPGQTAGAQSTATSGAATTASTGATTTGTSTASTGATSAGSTSAGSTGTGTSPTGSGTTGAASTTGAAGTAPTTGTPTTGAAATGTYPGAGTGASAGAAGLPSTSQSSGSGGG